MEGEAVVVHVDPKEINHPISFITVIQRTLKDMFDPVAARLKGVFAPLGRLRPPPAGVVAFGPREEGVLIPQSELNFIVTGLLGFVAIKSQGNTNFPFQSHPKTVMLSITSFLMYGFSSAAEHIVTGLLGSDSVYAFIARLGWIASLCILRLRGTGNLEVDITTTTIKGMTTWLCHVSAEYMIFY